MLAAIVCEGPTDYVVLRELLFTLCPHIEDVIPLQPEMDETTAGPGGWGLVRKWCVDRRGDLAPFLSYRFGKPIDILLVHVDGDIAAQLGVKAGGRAPAEVAAEICAVVKGWLGHPPRQLPSELIITIPMQSTEAWILAGLVHKGALDFELTPNPVGRLVAAGYIEADTDGAPIKDLASYRSMAEELVKNLPQLLRCKEAGRFQSKVNGKCA